MNDSHDHSEKRVKVRYFASLRDQSGKSEEWLEESSVTLSEIYAKLRKKYGFLLEENELRVAVNGKFSEMFTRVQAADEIVFIPPVSGG